MGAGQRVSVAEQTLEVCISKRKVSKYNLTI